MEEIKYPIKFKWCPVCGHDSTVINDAVEEEKKKGHIPMEGRIPALKTEAHIRDNSRQIASKVKFPVIVAYYDICSTCGLLYCKEVHKMEGIVTPKPKLDAARIILPGFQNPKNQPFAGKN